MRLLLVLLLVGCGGLAEKPYQAYAVQLVWDDTYHAEAAPPAIEWREDDCGGPLAGARVDGVCYSGRTLSADLCIVAWRDSFAASAFAHELLHAWQVGRGIWDDQHTSSEWSLEKIANEKLLTL